MSASRKRTSQEWATQTPVLEEGSLEGGRPDKRQVSEERVLPRIGMARPCLNQTSTSLHERAPPIRVTLEDETLWALSHPGAQRSFVDPMVAKRIASLHEGVDPPCEFACAGEMTMLSGKVIHEALPKVDGRCGRHPLYVGAIGYDMILGYGSLDRVGAVWDSRDKSSLFPPNRESNGHGEPPWVLRALDGLGSQPVEVQGGPSGTHEEPYMVCKSSPPTAAGEG